MTSRKAGVTITAAPVLQRIRQTLGDVLEGVPYLWLVGWAF
jgi:hypothetical protein